MHVHACLSSRLRFTFPTAEYAERYFNTVFGNGEGLVGPGSYDVTGGHSSGGPAWTIGWERRLAGNVVRGGYNISLDCEPE